MKLDRFTNTATKEPEESLKNHSNYQVWLWPATHNNTKYFTQPLHKWKPNECVVFYRNCYFDWCWSNENTIHQARIFQTQLAILKNNEATVTEKVFQSRSHFHCNTFVMTVRKFFLNPRTLIASLQTLIFLQGSIPHVSSSRCIKLLPFLPRKKAYIVKPSENQTYLSIAWSSNYRAIYISHFRVRYMYAR